MLKTIMKIIAAFPDPLWIWTDGKIIMCETPKAILTDLRLFKSWRLAHRRFYLGD